VLASVGSVGDAYDNAMAESFVDSFKTELIADRVWRSRTQLELAVVEYIGWFNQAASIKHSTTSRPSSSNNTTLATSLASGPTRTRKNQSRSRQER
jgi:putative transposase